VTNLSQEALPDVSRSSLAQGFLLSVHHPGDTRSMVRTTANVVPRAVVHTSNPLAATRTMGTMKKTANKPRPKPKPKRTPCKTALSGGRRASSERGAAMRRSYALGGSLLPAELPLRAARAVERELGGSSQVNHACHCSDSSGSQGLAALAHSGIRTTRRAVWTPAFARDPAIRFLRAALPLLPPARLRRTCRRRDNPPPA
jgi:hypothetical protein